MKGLLYTIADMMQVPLHYNASTERISGLTEFTIKLDRNVNLEIPLDAVASFVNLNTRQVGAIFKVKGNMHILVANNGKKDAMSAFVIDASMVTDLNDHPRDVIDPLGTIKQAVNAIGPGIKKSYMRVGARGSWSPFDIPAEVFK